VDKLGLMATFVRIVDSGSLSAAAEAQGQSSATVVRALAALERHLGVRLLNRSTRRLALTEEGREYLARCRSILAQVSEAEELLAERRQQPGGTLALTAPVTFGRYHLTPLVKRFMAEHREIRIELHLTDQVLDLLQENLDLAVRIGHLADSTLVTTPLGHTAQILCASPACLRRIGVPTSPLQLAELPCVLFSPQGRNWRFPGDGREWVVPVTPAFTTNQVEVAREACLDGLGIGRFFHYQVADALADGRLQRLLADFEPEPLPVQLTYPHARLLSSRVRSFIDWAAPRLRLCLVD